MPVCANPPKTRGIYSPEDEQALEPSPAQLRPAMLHHLRRR